MSPLHRWTGLVPALAVLALTGCSLEQGGPGPREVLGPSDPRELPEPSVAAQEVGVPLSHLGLDLALPPGLEVRRPGALDGISVIQVTDAAGTRVEIYAERLPSGMGREAWRAIQQQLVPADYLTEKTSRPVTVAGRGPYGFIVDTGAERTVIARELAETLGLGAGNMAILYSMTEASRIQTVLIPAIEVGRRTISEIHAPALERRNLGAEGLLARPERDILVGDNPAELASQISRLLADADFRQNLGLAGRRYVESEHQWGASAARFEALYNEAIERRQARSGRTPR